MELTDRLASRRSSACAPLRRGWSFDSWARRSGYYRCPGRSCWWGRWRSAAQRHQFASTSSSGRASRPRLEAGQRGTRWPKRWLPPAIRTRRCQSSRREHRLASGVQYRQGDDPPDAVRSPGAVHTRFGKRDPGAGHQESLLTSISGRLGKTVANSAVIAIIASLLVISRTSRCDSSGSPPSRVDSAHARPSDHSRRLLLTRREVTTATVARC